MEQIETASDLVKQIKLAIFKAQESLAEGRLRVSRVDLKIKTTLRASAEAGIKFEVVPIELGGSYKHSSIQTINLSLVPDVPSIELLAPVSDQLKDAIEVVSRTVRESSESNPRFSLKEATVELDVAVAKDGSIKVFVGGKAEKEMAHNIRLILAPV